jgi:hypothetical protein
VAVQINQVQVRVNGRGERLSFSRYGPSDQINLGFFFMVAARSIVLPIFILAATSLIIVIRTLGSSATSTRMFGYFSWHTGVGTIADGD